MQFKTIDGKTYILEDDFKALRQSRAWDYFIDEYLHLSYIKIDSAWWADLDSIEPSAMKDLIVADVKTLLNEP